MKSRKRRDWLTTTEAGRAIGSTRMGVVELCKEGLLAHFSTPGGLYRVHKESVADYLRENSKGLSDEQIRRLIEEGE